MIRESLLIAGDHDARCAPSEPGMPVPPILVVAPPPMTEPTSPHDGIHRDADQHQMLGCALAKNVATLLASV